MSVVPSTTKPAGDISELASFVHRLWVDAFNKGAISSFVMLDYLVKQQARKGYSDFLADWQGFHKSIKKDKILKDDMDGALKRVWAQNMGRCTSFTLRIIDRADRERPGVFEWEVHRLGVHHLARCRRTGILVDSSSRRGVKVLPEKEWLSFNSDSKQWYYADGSSQFKSGKPGSQTKVSNGPVPKKEALTFCLLNILSDHQNGPNTLCYFREFSNGRARFLGMLRWNYASRCVELVRGLRNLDSQVVIKFGEGKTQADHEECAKFMAGWIRGYGGAFYEQQWYTAKVYDLQEELFTASVRAWGFPKVKGRGKSN